MSDSSVSSYFTNLFSTQQGRALVIGSVALGSSLLTAATIYGAQRFKRSKRRRDLGEDIRRVTTSSFKDEVSVSSTDGRTPRYLQAGPGGAPARTPSHLRQSHSFQELEKSNGVSHPSSPSPTPNAARRKGNVAQDWDESLIREQLSRNYSFLGEEGMEKLRGSFVIVVGAGGVGSWAALMLLRSGISKLRLIDFDQVSLSSLNRHACANLSDVGRPKVVCCSEKFSQIAPWARLEAWVELFRGEEAERLLSGKPDYVVDAIDNIDTKVELLRYCAENRIKVISSMGAGAKSDPSRIQISDISTTSEDPLARSVRRRLRALGIPPLPPKEEEAAKSKKAQVKARANKQKKATAQEGLKPEAEDMERTPMKRSLSPSDTALEMTSSPSGTSPLVSRSTSQESLKGAAAVQPPSSSPSPLRGSSPTYSRPPMGKGSVGHSRRASSVSSFGSGVYGTPLTTPSDEMAALIPDGEREDMGLEPLDSPPPTIPEVKLEHEADEGQADVAAPVIDEQEEGASQGVVRPLSEGEEVVNSAPCTPPSLSESTPTLTNEKQGWSGVDLEGQDRVPSSKRHSTSSNLELEELEPEDSGYVVQQGEEDDQGKKREGDEPSLEEPTFFIPCIYSTEKSDTRLLPLDEAEFEKGDVDELAALEDFRVRILPVLGPLPAMFGLAAATHIICELAGHKMEPLAFKGRRKLYEKIFNDLSVSESRYRIPTSSNVATVVPTNLTRPTTPSFDSLGTSTSTDQQGGSLTKSTSNMTIRPKSSTQSLRTNAKVGGGGGKENQGPIQQIPFNLNDVAYLFEEVFNGRSVVPPYQPLSSAQLERWDSTLPISFDNIALFSRAQAKVHETEVLKNGRSPVEVWGKLTSERVKRRLATERRMRFFR
ncbi:hypothetical protein IE53DRAFT_391192 [Violaceomyces palustris]|uniref:Uncharacterized protein n=1 Tax=Violaceomyces palustris TaxID=1673888 RepID=A0ACD0NLD9_9BASI|nr:hypothetical protein IE53DRAFT_391192 [Violaceomyces palustris]